MANAELENFLNKGVPEPEPPTPVVAPEPEPAAAEVIPETGTPESPVQAKDEADAESPEADAEVPEGEPIPRGAFDKMRHERQDWKARAIEEKTRREGLERQLEDAKRAAEAPRPPQPQYQQPPPGPPEMPNPAVDPEGFNAWLNHRDTMHRANISEMQLRAKIGNEQVNALIVEWQQAVAQDPTLVSRAAQQVDPYAWAYQQVERMRVQAEIGDDPAAWREAEREKLRAELAANGNGAVQQPPQQRVSPVAGMAPSLANARSVARRSELAFTGPTPFSEILRRN